VVSTSYIKFLGVKTEDLKISKNTIKFIPSKPPKSQNRRDLK